MADLDAMEQAIRDLQDKVYRLEHATLVEPAPKRCAKCDGHGMLYADSACHHCGGEGMEPAPKTEEPATFPAALSVLRELVAAVKDESVRSNWETRTRLLAALSKAEKLANVPEPPPVEVITGVATWLENCSREVVGVHEDIAVASWLRAVAAAMGGGK
jgi:hypothetical protein